MIFNKFAAATRKHDPFWVRFGRPQRFDERKKSRSAENKPPVSAWSGRSAREANTRVCPVFLGAMNSPFYAIYLIASYARITWAGCLFDV